MSRTLRRHDRCLNCDMPLGNENFCPQCGQENSDYRVSLLRLLGDLADELFQIESKLWRSSWTLFRRPGLLAEDYSAGRRVRWTTPLRLYLLANVVYFAVVALVPLQIQVQVDDNDRRVMAEAGIDAKQPLSKAKPSNDGFIERRLRHQLHITPGGDEAAVKERAKELFVTNTPKVMVPLLPIFAALTWLLFRRPRRFFVEHLVLALHLHAVAFVLLTLAALMPRQGVSLALMLPVIPWMALALRRLFPQPWWRILAKLAVVGVVYLLAVGGGMLLVMLI